MKRSLIYGLALSLSLSAVRAADPVCGTPSSLNLVRSIRLKMGAERRGKFSALQGELLPSLSIERNSISDPLRLIFFGPPGKTFQVEATTALGMDAWQSLLTLSLENDPLAWEIPPVDPVPWQFFRMRGGPPDSSSDWASNFRLLDEQGTARDLYYHTHMEAMVVVAAGTNLNQVTPFLPVLADLSKSYTNRLQTWVLLSDPAPIRSNLVAEAKKLGISFPVLADSQGLAARSVGLSRAGEVAVVRPPDFTITYRGAVSAPGQTSSEQSYLGRALAAATSGQIPTFSRTPGSGPRLGHLRTTIPDYSGEVAPILRQYCVQCHRPNTVAPFALTRYSVVQEQAGSMKHALLSRQMPPWHADPEFGHFANDISLPDEARSLLVRWIDAGAPRGSGPDPLLELPSTAQYDAVPPELGAPDQIVKIPLQQIKASGAEPYRYIFVQAANPSNVWLRAAIIRHSNYRAVHHSLVWLNRIGNSGSTDNSSYQPHIAEYVPGYKPGALPTNTYIALNKTNWLTFNLHYTPYDNVATNDQPELHLWYHTIKPARSWNSISLGDATFTIPPGARDHSVQAVWSITTPTTLYRLNPHMHLRGKRMKFEVRYPNNTRETLLSVPDYDFMWQIGFQFAQPKVIPTGSQIIVSGAFDNSPQNLANPDPEATVRWGDQSWMEMFVGFIDYSQ